MFLQHSGDCPGGQVANGDARIGTGDSQGFAVRMKPDAEDAWIFRQVERLQKLSGQRIPDAHARRQAEREQGAVRAEYGNLGPATIEEIADEPVVGFGKAGQNVSVRRSRTLTRRRGDRAVTRATGRCRLWSLDIHSGRARAGNDVAAIGAVGEHVSARCTWRGIRASEWSCSPGSASRVLSTFKGGPLPDEAPRKTSSMVFPVAGFQMRVLMASEASASAELSGRNSISIYLLFGRHDLQGSERQRRASKTTPIGGDLAGIPPEAARQAHVVVGPFVVGQRDLVEIEVGQGSVQPRLPCEPAHSSAPQSLILRQGSDLGLRAISRPHRRNRGGTRSRCRPTATPRRCCDDTSARASRRGSSAGPGWVDLPEIVEGPPRAKAR